MDKKEIDQLLSSLSDQLKSEIEVAQTNLKEARSLTGKIERLYDKAIKLADNLESDLPIKLERADSATATLAASAAEVETQLNNIKTNLADTESNIANMQTAYVEFQAVKAKIDDPNTGLRAISAQVELYSSQIQNYSSEAKRLTSSIEANLASVQSDIQAMQTAYVEFQAVKAKIDDPNTGLEATYQAAQQTQLDINALQQESNTLYTEIARFKDTAAKNIASIQAIKDDSDRALGSIRDNEKESDTLKEKIAAVFNLVSRAGHANYFDERRRRLIFASWAWLAGAVIFAVAAAIIASILIVPLVKIDQAHSIDNLPELLIVRLSVLTPFLLLSLFCGRQYSKERRLAEQYAFKGVSAITIESSLNLLDRALDQHDCDDKADRIVKFGVDTMTSIYTEPQELIKTTRFHLTGGNKLATVGAELNETLENVGKDLNKVVAEAKSVQS